MMATCTLTIATNSAAISGEVLIKARPNQIHSSANVDQNTIVATASGTSYTATLQQNTKYRIWSKSDRLYFGRGIFTTPAASTANLRDLLDGQRST